MSRAGAQRAFTLGWHVAELRYLPGDPPDPPQNLHRTSELTFAQRAKLLIAQISADLTCLAVPFEAGPEEPAAASGPTHEGADTMASLDPIVVPAPGSLGTVDGKWATDVDTTLHTPLLVWLTVKNVQLGKAYSLGVGLSSAVFESYEALPAACKTPKRPSEETSPTLSQVRGCVAKGFSAERVRELWSDMKDLKSLLPIYAADPVAASMLDWCKWATGSAAKHGQPCPASQIETVAPRLRRQGQIWRALLSGERTPTDVLLVANYVDGAIDLVRKYGRLVVRVLGANLGTVVIVAFTAAVLGAAVLLLQAFHTSIVSSVAGALAALGLSGAGIVAAVKSIIRRAEEALWETELTAAIGVAINYVPAVPHDSEVEKLRVDDPGTRGPVTEPLWRLPVPAMARRWRIPRLRRHVPST